MPRAIVIGGGITGASTARDLAMRGCEVTLLDRGRIARGTTGRSHGLLHSGARYADEDPDVARECIAENRVLKDVAPHCIDDTGGLFLALPEDGDYHEEKRAACREAGIPVEDVDDLPDAVADDITAAFHVPDAAVDPAWLTVATALSAERHGAEVRTGTAVQDIAEDDGRIAVTTDAGTIAADHVVNAAGPWSGRVAAMADATVPVALSGGVMATVAADTPAVLNRCRPTSSGDIAVPHPDGAILGTTSTAVDDPAADAPDREGAVATLREELAAILPAARDASLVESFWGIRPLYATGEGDRSTSRHHAVIDHAERDGFQGLTSIVGGKLTTSRLMAEDTADAVCTALNLSADCETAEEQLPGRDDPAALDDAMDRWAADVPTDRGGATR